MRDRKAGSDHRPIGGSGTHTSLLLQLLFWKSHLVFITGRVGCDCQTVMRQQHQSSPQNLVGNSHLPSAHTQYCPSPPSQSSQLLFHYVHLCLWQPSVLKGTLCEWKPFTSFFIPRSPHQHLEQDFYSQQVFCSHFIYLACLFICFKECLYISGSKRVHFLKMTPLFCCWSQEMWREGSWKWSQPLLTCNELALGIRYWQGRTMTPPVPETLPSAFNSHSLSKLSYNTLQLLVQSWFKDHLFWRRFSAFLSWC